MLLFWSSRFADHTTPPGHPERPARADVFNALAATWRSTGGSIVEPRPATVEELRRVHLAAHIEAIKACAGRSAMVDEDTYTSPESYDIALLAAGAAIDAARHAVASGQPTLALVRPPGHHAEPGRAMGFCLFNNIAVAASALRADGVARVAIVDIDVHHGNGTQAAFYDDPAVFYVSTHQFPFYPGTGAVGERGSGTGLGATLNVPLPAGTRDEDFVSAYEREVVPALEAFRPDALLVSAGYDAHVLDPLGGLRVTTDGYRRVVALLDAASERLCGRRASWISEGGYHLDALRACLDATIDVLS